MTRFQRRNGIPRKLCNQLMWAESCRQGNLLAEARRRLREHAQKISKEKV